MGSGLLGRRDRALPTGTPRGSKQWSGVTLTGREKAAVNPVIWERPNQRAPHGSDTPTPGWGEADTWGAGPQPAPDT